MPEYLYPGVYVEEIDTGNKPIEGVSTSTVGFIGLAEKGPLKPTLVTSFGEYTRIFGRHTQQVTKNNVTSQEDRLLTYAVEGFFQNGGKRCFVTRVAHKDTANPAKSAKPAAKAFGGMQVTAVGPGEWGKRIAVEVAPASSADPDFFKLIVRYWAGTPPTNLIDDPTMVEVFEDLSASPQSGNFYESRVTYVSELIELKQTASGIPSVSTPKLLENGTEGDPIAIDDFKGDDSDPENVTGLAALALVDEVSILCCPDEFYLKADDDRIAKELVSQCENLKYRFAILQSPRSAKKPDAHFPTAPSKRGYAAYYHPWLWVTRPVVGTSVLIPPGGHIAGIYARSDTDRGVHKDPANEIIRGIDELQLQINAQQQAILNPKGINALRNFRGL